MVQKTIPQLNPTTSFDQNALVPIDTGIQSFKITAKNFALSIMKLFDVISLKNNPNSMDFMSDLDDEMQLSLHKPESAYFHSGSALFANRGSGKGDLIAMNGTVKAFLASFAMFNRVEGTTLTARNSWEIAAGPFGSIVIATQEGALAGQIQRSTDGITWTSVTAPSATNCSAIYAGHNDVNADCYVIFGWDGISTTKILYSVNGGVSWAAGTVPTALNGKVVSNTAKCAFGRFADFSLGYLLCVHNSDQIFKSTNNGSTWSNTTAPLATPRCILYVGDVPMPFKLFGVNAGGLNEVWESENGTTWSKIPAVFPASWPLSVDILNVAYNGNAYVAMGQNEAAGLEVGMFSNDLINWYSPYFPIAGWIRLLSTYSPYNVGIQRTPSKLFLGYNKFSEDGRVWVEYAEDNVNSYMNMVYAPVIKKIIGVSREGATAPVKSFASMRI